jgi:hypothetical protein
MIVTSSMALAILIIPKPSSDGCNAIQLRRALGNL